MGLFNHSYGFLSVYFNIFTTLYLFIKCWYCAIPYTRGRVSALLETHQHAIARMQCYDGLTEEQLPELCESDKFTHTTCENCVYIQYIHLLYYCLFVVGHDGQQ